jgi:hypothetical protein
VVSARRTITFDESVTSKRAARDALKPYLDDYNAKAKANSKPAAPQKSVNPLADCGYKGLVLAEIHVAQRNRSDQRHEVNTDEWTDKILPNRKLGGARAVLSHEEPRSMSIAVSVQS